MEYEIIRSKRRTMSLQVKRDGRIIVRAPLILDKKVIEDFVSKHTEWVKKKQEMLKNIHTTEDFDKNEVNFLKSQTKQVPSHLKTHPLK